MNQHCHIEDPLLKDIERFLRLTGMGPSAFGKNACGNSELVKRMRRGGECLPRTQKKVRAYMAQYFHELGNDLAS